MRAKSVIFCQICIQLCSAWALFLRSKWQRFGRSRLKTRSKKIYGCCSRTDIGQETDFTLILAAWTKLLLIWSSYGICCSSCAAMSLLYGGVAALWARKASDDILHNASTINKAGEKKKLEDRWIMNRRDRQWLRDMLPNTWKEQCRRTF